ncbi:MAG TPA: M23 family metallopeptidase [Chitinophagaceae bacterium]|nr:M23 family metallopeptidase [Chitinophagaceae bacterium]MCB9055342.1 M23 family metallopeptidase [Chitinophagales bacterium]HPG10238.1 M23 family metallopeptidase [Chitinophagaceae bacterium]HRX92548.1 M23 family metallopeptidase [Chitinophagaceae bacterium]
MYFLNLLLIFLTFFSLDLQSQTTKEYPRNFFRNPLAIPMQLSANFGELRSNHWHMGLDIRTNAKENYRVYAAADGYVAHIGVRPNSFGSFIIINHANGLSTLYGHLNEFFPELEKYVIDQQYKKESWAIELDFTKEQFPVKKGEFIAFSGNTGGSLGPHLHFEIIDTKTEKRLNPLLFNLPVSDNIPPTLVRLALYDRSKSVYEQSPELTVLKKTSGGYMLSGSQVLTTDHNEISFAIQAYDKSSGSGSRNGIYAAQLYFDGEEVVKFVLDSIDYDETLYMNAHIDYKHDYNGGVYLQHLSKMPGDNGPVYKSVRGDGVISLNDTAVHTVSIEVQDTKGNNSVLNFSVRYNGEEDPLMAGTSVRKKLKPGALSDIIKPGFSMSFREGTFYDEVPTSYLKNTTLSTYALTAAHTVSDESIPMHKRAVIRIKPDRNVPEGWKDKIVMTRTGKGTSVRKASWDGEWIKAEFGDFGTFQAFADIIPPSINDPGRGDTINLSAASRILFTPRDNYDIESFRAELDGNWLRFTNDKGKNWIYKFDDRCPYGVHELKVKVADIAGNTITKTWWFRREPYTPSKKRK